MPEWEACYPIGKIYSSPQLINKDRIRVYSQRNVTWISAMFERRRIDRGTFSITRSNIGFISRTVVSRLLANKTSGWGHSTELENFQPVKLPLSGSIFQPRRPIPVLPDRNTNAIQNSGDTDEYVEAINIYVPLAVEPYFALPPRSYIRARLLSF